MKATLLAALSIVAFAALSVSNVSGSDIGGVQFKILSPDGKQTLGSTRFSVVQNNSTEEIKGETTYFDGERDNEDEILYAVSQTDRLRLETYTHSFFNADGTLRMLDTLDAKSGTASCATFTSGNMKLRKSQLEIPADSFAGASGLMMMVESLRHGSREIRFHAFACAPGPGLFSVKASIPDRSDHWSLYPGDLVRLDMRPDLGALNLLIAPFLPTMDAWFNPADNWNYIGGEFDRYFRGPHVLTVRVRPAD